MSVFQKLLFPLLIFIIMLLVTCSHSTEPGKPPFKDPRDMTWEVDTLEYPGSAQVMMTSIWADSPTDVWICGHNDRSKGNLWHYNGEEWADIYLGDYIQRSPNSLNEIQGIAPDNIWIVGDRTFSDWAQEGGQIDWFEDLVVHFNGDTWEEYDLNTRSRILGLNINNASDIWICGDNGLVANYNGSGWSIDTINIPVLNGASYFLNSVVIFDNEIHLNAYVHDSQRLRQSFYHITGYLNNWVVIDSMIFEGNSAIKKWGYWGFYAGDFGKLYSYGPGGIWKWNGESWEEELMLNYPIEGIYGVAEDYILAAGQFGHIFFYDGTTWNHLSATANTSYPILYTDAWTDGYEAVIIGYTTDGYPMKTVVWRGK